MDKCSSVRRNNTGLFADVVGFLAGSLAFPVSSHLKPKEELEPRLCAIFTPLHILLGTTEKSVTSGHPATARAVLTLVGERERNGLHSSSQGSVTTADKDCISNHTLNHFGRKPK